MILYKKKTKAVVRSPDGDTDFFDIVIGVMQRDTLTLFLSHNLPILHPKKINRSYEKKISLH